MTASFTIRRTWEVGGALTDPTSVVLRDSANAYGVKRQDTGEIVVAAGTAFTRVGVGAYEHEMSGLVAGVTYLAATEIVYDGQTYRFETEHVALDDSAIVTEAEVLAELGITTATAAETAAVANAVRKAHGAVRQWIGYDPVYATRTEFHPQQPFQAQISRGIWEVMEQRAVLRQVAEAATNELQLRHLPLRGVTSVNVDYDGRSGTRTGTFGAETLRTFGADYWPNYDCYDSAGLPVSLDGVLRTIGLWPTTPNTVKVVYSAGYTAAELRGSDPILNAEPIWEATLSEAVRRARQTLTQQKGSMGMPVGPSTSESLGDYSYSTDPRLLARLFAPGLAADNIVLLQPFVNYGYALGS